MRLFLRGTIISSYHQMANDKITNNVKMSISNLFKIRMI